MEISWSDRFCAISWMTTRSKKKQNSFPILKWNIEAIKNSKTRKTKTNVEHCRFTLHIRIGMFFFCSILKNQQTNENKTKYL